MTGNGSINGRYQLLASNALLVEVFRNVLYLVIFLWFASSLNSRFSRIETKSDTRHKETEERSKSTMKRIERLEARLTVEGK